MFISKDDTLKQITFKIEANILSSDYTINYHFSYKKIYIHYVEKPSYMYRLFRDY